MSEAHLFDCSDDARPRTGTERMVSIPAGLGTKAELLEALRLALALPDYFGRNWDALNEVLRDLDWIRERDVVIVHSDLPLQRGDEKDLATYLRVLSWAIRDWRKRPGAHELHVQFPSAARAAVTAACLDSARSAAGRAEDPPIGSWTVRAYFCVRGFDCDPAEITRRLGVQPTRTQSIGDSKSVSPGIYDWNSWVLESLVNPASTLEAHAVAILDQLPKDLQALQSVTGDWNAVFQFVVTIRKADEKPPMAFARHLIEHLGRLGTALDIDLYVQTT